MVVNGTKPFLEINANRTRVFNVTTRTSTTGGTFGTFIQVDDDQAFLLDGLDTVGTNRTLRCDATYCGAYVTAPGPFNTWSAVGWLKHLNISAQCKGNGVEGLFGGRSGGDKKEAAISFASAALGMTEAVASRDILDEDKFKEGLGKVIDGTVQCLNASTWAKR